MPEMNGFEATEFIRNKLKLKIPIIALTADVTTVDLAKCEAVGMNDYIAKPVDEGLLYSKLIGLAKKSVAAKAATILPEGPEALTEKFTDLTYLNTRTKSNPTLMLEMISLYLQQTPPLVDSMKKTYQEKDWVSMHAAVHKLIPSFAIVGISKDFETMAKVLQDYAGAKQKGSEISGMISKLEKVCLQACVELEAESLIIKNKNK